MDELDETVLNIQQRQKRAQILRRYKSKIERGRELAKKRMAPEQNIKKRAYAQARMMVRRRVAGARGAEYEKLGPSEKMMIDRAVEGKQKLIKKIALRLLPKVKQAEQQRLHTFMKGQNIQNQGQPEGNHKESSPVAESVNRLFAEQFPPAAERSSRNGLKADINPTGSKPKGEDGQGNPNIIQYNKFGNEKLNDSSAYKAIKKKAEKTGIKEEVLGEVYDRGLAAWSEDIGVSQQQYAFARVNSYINQGKTYFNEDADLHEGMKEKIKGVIRREKAKDMPLVQNRRDYAATKAGEAYEKGDEKKGRRYMDWREKSLKKEDVELDENAWNQLGQKKPVGNTLPAPAKGSVPKHGRKFSEGDHVVPHTGPYAGQVHRVTSSRAGSVNIVRPNTPKYDSVTVRAKHEHLSPATPEQTAKYKAERAAEHKRMFGEDVELDEMKTVTNRSHAKALTIKIGGKEHSYRKYGWGLHHPTYGPLKDEQFNSKAEMKAAMEKHPHYNPKLTEETELDEGRAPGTPSIKRYTRNDGTTALKSLNKWGKRKDWRDTEGGLAKAKEHAGVDKITEEMQKHHSWEVTIQHGPAGHDNKKIKVKAPDAETAQNKAEIHFKKKYPGLPRGRAEDYRKLEEVQQTNENFKNKESIVPQTTSPGSKIRKKLEVVDRKPPHIEYTRQAEIKHKIIDEEGNSQNDPKKRLQGTNSLVKAYKKDTPGQCNEGLNESFNIAFASGVGVTLTSADLGMKAVGGFALHPSVIEEMERRAEVEEEVRSADIEGTVVHTTSGKVVVRRQKANRKIIGTGDLTDGQANDTQ